MPHTTDVVYLVAEDIPLLKSAARLHMREIPPALRLEILARALGYCTYNALLAEQSFQEVGEVMVTLDPKAAADFAQSRGHLFNADVLNAVLDDVEDAQLDQDAQHLSPGHSTRLELCNRA